VHHCHPSRRAGARCGRRHRFPAVHRGRRGAATAPVAVPARPAAPATAAGPHRRRAAQATARPRPHPGGRGLDRPGDGSAPRATAAGSGRRPPATYTGAAKAQRLAAGYPGTTGLGAADVAEHDLVRLALGGYPRSEQKPVAAAPGTSGGRDGRDGRDVGAPPRDCPEHLLRAIIAAWSSVTEAGFLPRRVPPATGAIAAAAPPSPCARPRRPAPVPTARRHRTGSVTSAPACWRSPLTTPTPTACTPRPMPQTPSACSPGRTRWTPQRAPALPVVLPAGPRRLVRHLRPAARRRRRPHALLAAVAAAALDTACQVVADSCAAGAT